MFFDYCNESGCFRQKNDKARGCCYDHWRICQKSSCNTRISVGEDYCSAHQDYYCKKEGCLTKINNERSYCLHHIVQEILNCQVDGCSIRQVSGSVYCPNHLNYCSSCFIRIASHQSYCSVCESEIKKKETEQNSLKSLVRQKTSLSNPQEVIRFETWWNNNLATVINYNNSFYWVFLIVYEPKHRNLEENLAVFPTDHSYQGNYGIYLRKREKNSSLSSAQNEAEWLKGMINDDNPILTIHPYASEYKPFSWVVESPYVVKNQVGSSTKTIDVPLFFVGYNSSTPADLDNHFRPLDIVWVKCVDWKIGTRFYHVGFYLGNDTVFHFSGENNAVEKTSWDGFLRNTTRKVIRYHPVIPFKNYRDVVKQAVWAKDNGFQKGNYNLPNRNCEHFANMCVYGINFSQQVREREGELIAKATVQQAGVIAYGVTTISTSIFFAPFTFGLSLIPGAVGAFGYAVMTTNQVENHLTLNNGKTSMCLNNEIRDTDNRLEKNLTMKLKNMKISIYRKFHPRNIVG
jgi:Lecithin retinol acyltransferase